MGNQVKLAEPADRATDVRRSGTANPAPARLHQKNAGDTKRGARSGAEAGAGELALSEPWYRGSSLDDFLKEEGVYEPFIAAVEKEVIAWQIAEAMKTQRLTKTRMAALMQTSRSQIDKLLDPHHGNVTLETLQKAASVLGKRLELKLT